MDMHDHKPKQIYRGLLLVAFLVICTAVSVWYMAHRKTTDIVSASETTYHAHYAFIADNMEERQWKSIYQEMKTKGAAIGVFVECMNESFPQEYTRTDFVKIAASMKVDGILLEGDDDPELCEAVDQAVDSNIPVITLMTDCPDSKRQCFIEMGKYNLGREYARQIIDVATKETKTVLVLTHNMEKDSSQNLILAGIRDTLHNEGNHLVLDMETEAVGSEEFDSAQTLRQRLLGEEEQPDILLCLNDQDTVNAYQVLVDYNMVKTVKLIGASTDDTVLNGIQKGAIQSVIPADTTQAGIKCLTALEDYREDGHVSDYIALDSKVIRKENVKEYLADETEE